MSKPKAKPVAPVKPLKKKGAAPTKAKVAEPAAPAPYNPSTARATLATIVARIPALQPQQRRAFQQLANDQERSKLGTRTKGIGVLQEGVTWAVQIDGALRQYGSAALKGYSITRFAYLLEGLGTLANELSRAGAQAKKVGTVRGTATSRRDEALSARQDLISALHTFAGERDPEREAIGDAIGTTDTDDHLGGSIAALGELGTKWLSRNDDDSVFLAENAGLTADLASQALDAARALTGSAAGAKLEGRAVVNDPPLVNLAEGAVLLEMKEAMRLFGEANAKHPAVRKLSPGPATRSVLGARRAAAPATPPTTSPAAPVVQGTAIAR